MFISVCSIILKWEVRVCVMILDCCIVGNVGDLQLQSLYFWFRCIDLLFLRPL